MLCTSRVMRVRHVHNGPSTPVRVAAPLNLITRSWLRVRTRWCDNRCWCQPADGERATVTSPVRTDALTVEVSAAIQQRPGGAAEGHHVQQSVSRQRRAALLAALAGAPRAVDPQRVHRYQRYTLTAILVVVASALNRHAGLLGGGDLGGGGAGTPPLPSPDQSPSAQSLRSKTPPLAVTSKASLNSVDTQGHLLPPATQSGYHHGACIPTVKGFHAC
jgi:hypothetical protein